MLYGIFSYICDNFEVEGYTEDLDEADKYCAVNNGCEIRPLESLKSNIDYSQYEFVYYYAIPFRFSNKTNKYERKDFPYNVPECDYCRCCVKNIGLYNFISYDKEYTIRFSIFLKDRNLELAYNTAETYMKDLLSRGNGKITQKNVDAMNDEFSKEYREEQERLKAEKERENRIRAFEGKIRKLESDIKNKENDLQKLKEEYEKEIGSK